MKFIALNQGLGDLINYASMLSQLSAREHIIITCLNKSNYKKNAEIILAGLDVEIIPVENIDQVRELAGKYENPLMLGVFSKNWNPREHIKDSYLEAGLKWEDREKYCPILRNIKKVNQFTNILFEDRYAFIPEGGSNGNYRIDRKYVDLRLVPINPPQDDIMFQWCNIIKNAIEIHCHYTSWPELIDKIPTNGKLFFHKYARYDDWGKPFTYKMDYLKKWKVIDYPGPPPPPVIMQKGRVI